MIPENVKIVVLKLIHKTESGETIWNKSSALNGYKIDLNSAVVSISISDVNYNQNIIAYLTIFNSNGDTIENISCEEGAQDFNLLKELYDTVNRKYLKVDETIKSILDEIDSETTIGIEIIPPAIETKSDWTDDLPF